MTISSEQNRVSYAGNGATTAFSVPFRFLANGDLVVILVDDDTGVPTTQTLVTDYTVSGSGSPAGGTVTFGTAPASGKTVRIWNDPDLTQLLDYIAGGPLPAEAHEKALDRATLQQKRTREIAERSLHIPDADPDSVETEIPNKVARADKVLGFDEDGNPALFSAEDPAFSTFAADRALQTDAGGSVEASSVTADELAHLDGVTSPIQTQLDGKAASSHTHDASDVDSGQFDDARFQQSNIKQFEGDLDIAASQVSNLAWEYLATVTGTGAASLDFTSLISASFKQYMVVIDFITPATDGVDLWLRFSEDNGSSWESGTGDYRWGAHGASDTSGELVTGSTSDTKIVLTGNSGNWRLGTGTGEGISGEIHIHKGGGSSAPKSRLRSYLDNFSEFPTLNHQRNIGMYTGANAINAFQILASSGNITGTVHVYGLRTS